MYILNQCTKERKWKDCEESRTQPGIEGKALLYLHKKNKWWENKNENKMMQVKFQVLSFSETLWFKTSWPVLEPER